MDHRRLGNSGLRVPALSFGTATFGGGTDFFRAWDVPLWLDSNNSAIGWGVDRTNYPMQEGTFFGNIIDTGNLSSIGRPSITAPVAYYCDGASFTPGSNGVVAGRIGANQVGAPYNNPYGSGTLCQNVGSSVGHYSGGTGNSCPPGATSAYCPDGYQYVEMPSGTPWSNAITVWRNPTYVPVFDPGYVYSIRPFLANGAVSLDTYGGHTSDGTIVQQWTTTSGAPQQFVLLPAGSNWKIAMVNNNKKCVDLAGGATARGTGLVINDCSSSCSSTQAWTITPDAKTGAFIFKNAAAGRCMDEGASNTASGLQMDIWDCNGGSNQKFNIQAY